MGVGYRQLPFSRKWCVDHRLTLCSFNSSLGVCFVAS